MFENYSEGENFKTLELSEKQYRNYIWEDCSFEQCNFKNAEFAFSRFSDCQFIGCDLSNIQLANAKFIDCSFKSCKLLGINWSNADTVRGLEFEDCLLDYNVLSGLKLPKTKFLKCRAIEANFTESDLSGSSFKDCDLSKARFAEADLRKCDFRGAINYNINPAFTKVAKAKFSMPEAAALLLAFDIDLS